MNLYPADVQHVAGGHHVLQMLHLYAGVGLALLYQHGSWEEAALMGILCKA